jgi:hypothetical protein
LSLGALQKIPKVANDAPPHRLGPHMLSKASVNVGYLCFEQEGSQRLE